MTFLIKQDYDEYIKQQHSCHDYLPDDDDDDLVPGDIFQCICGKHYCWGYYYSNNWCSIGDRRARKIIKAYSNGKPFKRHSTPTLGPQ